MPGLPAKMRAAAASGALSCARSAAGTTPTTTKTPRTYMSVATPSERNMPRGIVFSGSATSSETLATFVRPA